MNMSEEKAPLRKQLLEEGWRKFIVTGCEPSIAKSGNNMFVFKLTDDKTKYEDTVYLVAEPKKRWMLKSLLSVCGIKAAEDGIYNWDIPDVIGKEVGGLVEHEDNDYINRDGQKVTKKQHKIVEFRPVNDVISWDE